MWAEVCERRARVCALLMYAVFGFGGIYLFSAIGPDSNEFWDTQDQSSNAVIGVVLLGLGLPFGVASLVSHRRDRREYSAGQTSHELQHPGGVVAAMVVAAALIIVTLTLLSGALP